jgi:NAD(P)-dependent dehydrogenase (short-subunit alcohol dehydrogenase family)
MSDPLDLFRPGAFEKKVVVITGGGSGIGLEMAKAFGRLGASLVLASRDLEKCRRAAAEVEALGGKALAAAVNVRDPESVEAMAQGALEKFGRIDVLFANAGANFLAPAAQISPNGFRSVVETVLFGTFYCAQSCGRAMLAQGSGRIVAMTATNGMTGSPLMAHSGAAKAGVINLMQTLAAEWAPFGVTCNCLSPGAVNTEGASARLWAEPRFAKMVKDMVPLGRMAVPQDLIGAALFLASDASAFMTGANLVVDGGEIVRHFPSDVFD